MARAFIGTRLNGSAQSNRTRVGMERYTLDEALEAFIKAKEAEGVRPRTIHDYRKHIQYLKMFLKECNYDISDINELTAKVIREYIIYMKQTKMAYKGIENREKEVAGLSVNTINIRLRTLKTMCNFWFREQIIGTNPISNIKQVKDDEHTEVQGLNDEELNKLLGYFNTREYAQWRDKVLILLLLDTGMRINEAVNLKLVHIDFKLLTIHIPSEISKNRKGRDVPITREVAKLLQELHNETSNYFHECDYVFYNAYGEVFTAEAFRRRLNRIKKRIGFKKLHPHMFRHTFCRNFILNGGDIFTLQKIVDHADIKTTRNYLQMEKEHINQQHNKYSPVRKYLDKR
ncbi:tyrosine-type recombinase/integrase [Bacillus capparidis]|uniref:Integrase/recombinase XerD n=1 Tax=Bacillus capparidis TaxID=1840411 RepID=A0ABS4CT99_9BACI|nr:tyrosine-type recombinase/integrase [Bacillus capparidis]MBP1080781.1 integrase/recombinase XerD [Bacillus capparidis]MED1094633.1 tyrosine-type recombinase/integrase [Bacillus capparidis]